MSFKKWLDKEIKSYNDLYAGEDGLTDYGKHYYAVLRGVINTYDTLLVKEDIEKYIRIRIKKNIDKEILQGIYRHYLITEGYIEEDEIS